MLYPFFGGGSGGFRSSLMVYQGEFEPADFRWMCGLKENLVGKNANVFPQK